MLDKMKASFEMQKKMQEKTRLGSSLKDTFNRAIKRSQELAAQKMKDVTGLNIPGLM